MNGELHSSAGAAAGGELLKEIAAQLKSAIGPAPDALLAAGRAKIGLPDCSVVRRVEKYQQRISVANRLDRAYEPIEVGPGDLISLFNTSRLAEAGDGIVAVSPAAWNWLEDRLANHGIDLAQPGEMDASPIAKDWRDIVRMSATAAPIDGLLRGFHRLKGREDEYAQKWRDELDFHFRRAGYSREDDRKLLLYPYMHYSIEESKRLKSLGLIDEAMMNNLINAAGASRSEDANFVKWLTTSLPSPDELTALAMRRVWDDDLVGKYGLDHLFERSTNAVWWAKRQGAGNMPGPLPGQPDGESDWLKLAMRNKVPLVDFSTSCELQNRLRPNPDNPGMSVVPGITAWTAENTKDMLAMSGYSPIVSSQLMALTENPINIRIVRSVLIETLKHPDLSAQADRLLGHKGDWVKGAFLDHGFSDEVSEVTAASIRQAAYDEANAETYGLLKKMREDNRESIKRRYELGMLSSENARAGLTDKFNTEAMAVQQLELIDDKIRTDFVQVATNEVKAAFLEGKLSVQQVGAQFQVLGINGARQAYYMQEWVWQKNDRQRMLATGEILTALRKGLFSPQVALARLVNVGWTAPDALVELTLVENEIALAAAHTINAEKAKIIAADQRAKKEASAKAKQDAAEKAKAASEAKKKADRLASVPLEQGMAADKYTATALLDLEAWKRANKAKNENKMNAEINKAAAAYKELLLKQLAISQLGSEAASEIEPVERIDVPPIEDDAGINSGATDAAQPASGPTTEGSGTDEQGPIDEAVQ